MVEARVIGYTVSYGNQVWKMSSGSWYLQHFGWWPTGINPRWRWIGVAEDKVPDAVKQAAIRERTRS